MKKTIFITLAAALLVGSISAQVFVGGTFSFRKQSGSTSVGSITKDNASEYNFNFQPSIGYYLNERFAVGTSVGLSLNGYTEPDNGFHNEIKHTMTLFLIEPFIRYHLVEQGNLSFLGQAYAGIGFGSSNSKSDGVTTDEPSIFNLSIGIMPGVSYKFSDKIAIEAFLGGIQFGNSSQKETTGNIDKKTSTSYFSLGFNTSLNLGFTYKF